jgi:hypothetical protein
VEATKAKRLAGEVNPVKGKWKLATDNESYVHSSCLFYFKKKHRFCEATHYDEVLDWENMYK